MPKLPRKPKAKAPEVLTGLPVEGYRPQSENAVKLVNQHKRMEEAVLQHFDFLANEKNGPLIDQRWLSIARTHVEQGFMALNRAVFQPERIKL